MISHYFYREEAAEAAVKAFVVNTLGDVGMMLGIFLMWSAFGSVEYGTVFAAAPARLTQDDAATNTAVAITIAAADRRAGEVGSNTAAHLAARRDGRPDACLRAHPRRDDGHGWRLSSGRSWPLFEQAPATLTLITWIGALTALFGATIGLVQTNIKRVLAFSTISQLGYMFLAAGVGAYTAGIFHLLTHAFFKALLFLAAGVAIHALHGEEDLRRMGGLRHQLAVAWAAFGIGGLAIAGIPPFSGFFSKDEIIWSAFVSERGNAVLGLVALITGGITAFYVFRAFFLAFYGTNRAVTDNVHDESQEHGSHELHKPSLEMQIPLVILSVLAVVSGWVLIPGVVDLFEIYLEPVFEGLTIHVEPAGGVSYWLLATVATLLGAAGITFAYVAYVIRPEISANLARQFASAHRVLANRYYIDELYDFAIVRPTKILGRWLSRSFDRGIDNAVNAVGYLVREASIALRELQTGYVRQYALLIFVGAILIIGFIVFGIGSGA